MLPVKGGGMENNMKQKLNGKVALVTGSSSGIGKAIALKFAEEGADVIVTSSAKSANDGEHVAQLAQEMGTNSVYIQADLCNENEIELMFNEIEKKYGKLDILINNAGVQTGGDLESISIEKFEKEMQVNVYAIIKCSQLAKKIMGTRGWIINTSSFRGLDYAGRSPIMGYCATKAAVNNITRTMALELAPNIMVNAVMPGFVYTENYEKFSDELKKNWIENTAIKRFVKPEEIAEIYLMLATTEIITGTIVCADGGTSLLNR